MAAINPPKQNIRPQDFHLFPSHIQDPNLISYIDFITLPQIDILLLVTAFLWTCIGFLLFTRLHKCNSETSNISNEYEATDAKIKKIKDSIVRRMVRSQKLIKVHIFAIILMIVAIICFILIRNIWDFILSKPQFGIPITLLFLLFPILVYFFQKSNLNSIESEKQKQDSLLAGQQKRLSEILNTLPETMKKDLLAKFSAQSQNTIQQNELRIKRLEKECFGLSADVERHTELINGLGNFIWCDFCKLLNQEEYSKEFVQCENDCLGKFFSILRELSKEKERIGEILAEQQKEIVVLQEEEKSYEDVVKEAKEEIKFGPKNQTKDNKTKKIEENGIEEKKESDNK